MEFFQKDGMMEKEEEGAINLSTAGKDTELDGPITNGDISKSASGEQDNTSQVFEPQHDKTNKMTCVPSKNSDQPGHPPTLISLRCPHEEALGPLLLIKRTAKMLIRLGMDAQADLSLHWAHRSFW